MSSCSVICSGCSAVLSAEEILALGQKRLQQGMELELMLSAEEAEAEAEEAVEEVVEEAVEVEAVAEEAAE